MIEFMTAISLLLKQNEAEKTITSIGLAFFAAFIFYLILDSTIKQKFIPNNKAIRGFLIFIFLAASIACICYIIFIK